MKITIKQMLLLVVGFAILPLAVYVGGGDWQYMLTFAGILFGAVCIIAAIASITESNGIDL